MSSMLGINQSDGDRLASIYCSLTGNCFLISSAVFVALFSTVWYSKLMSNDHTNPAAKVYLNNTQIVLLFFSLVEVTFLLVYTRLQHLVHSVPNLIDAYFVMIIPILFLCLGADVIGGWEFPIIAGRIILLPARTELFHEAFASDGEFVSINNEKKEENSTKNPSATPSGLLRILSKRLSSSSRRMSSIPSDIPSLRLVQLMRRALEYKRNTGGVHYSSSELKELKQLLLLVCHQTLYRTDNIIETSNNSENSSSLTTSKNAAKGNKEFRDVESAWVHEKWQSKRGKTKRLSANEAHIRRLSITSLNAAVGDKALPRDSRVLSCPDRSSVVGLNLMRQGRQFKIDTFLVEKLDDWDFDVHLFGKICKGKPLTGLCSYIFSDSRYHWSDFLNTNEFYWNNFVAEIEKNYGDNVYHNKMHATDVVQSAHFMVHVAGMRNKLSELEVFSLMLASIVHDYRHPGLNNNFLVKTGHELALLHNDSSVLENHHISSAFILMQQEKLDPLKNLPKQEKAKCREICIALVLATDLKLHFDIVASFKNEVVAMGLSKTDTKATPEEEEQMNLMAMKMAIKCSDIGHPTKSPPLHLKWSRLIMREFFAQGDEERRRKFSISPLCDRKDVNSIPGSQKGFINFLVQPVYTIWTEYLTNHVDSDAGAIKIFAINMKENLALWESWGKEPSFNAMQITQIEIDHDEECKVVGQQYDEFSTSSMSTRNLACSISSADTSDLSALSIVQERLNESTTSELSVSPEDRFLRKVTSAKSISQQHDRLSANRPPPAVVLNRSSTSDMRGKISKFDGHTNTAQFDVEDDDDDIV